MFNKKFLVISAAIFLIVGCSKKQEEVEEVVPEVETVIFQPGDMFSKTFEQTKLSAQEANEILNELKKLVNINKCKPNDFYEVTYSTNTSKSFPIPLHNAPLAVPAGPEITVRKLRDTEISRFLISLSI